MCRKYECRKYVRIYAFPWFDQIENMVVLWVCLLKSLQKCSLRPFPGNLGVELARVHLPDEYLIKAWFKFGNVVVILCSAGGISPRPRPRGCQSQNLMTTSWNTMWQGWPWVTRLLTFALSLLSGLIFYYRNFLTTRHASRLHQSENSELCDIWNPSKRFPPTLLYVAHLSNVPTNRISKLIYLWLFIVLWL